MLTIVFGNFIGNKKIVWLYGETAIYNSYTSNEFDSIHTSLHFFIKRFENTADLTGILY